MNPDFRQELVTKAQLLGVTVDEAAVENFKRYLEILLEWNTKMNLTAITEPKEVLNKHFIDSLSLLGAAEIREGAAIADVGSGAGFPGIPLKIVRPDLRLTCIDSLGKRVHFLEELAAQLKLTDCQCIHLRAEDAGKDKTLRETFDVVTARAVASLPVLLEYCLPLVRVSGVFLAMKGPEIEEELENAKSAVKLLGGEIEAVKKFRLPESDIERSVVIFRKKNSTHVKYPRPHAQMAKKPL